MPRKVSAERAFIKRFNEIFSAGEKVSVLGKRGAVRVVVQLAGRSFLSRKFKKPMVRIKDGPKCGIDATCIERIEKGEVNG